MDNARKIAFDIICAVENGAYSNVELACKLKDAELSELDRAFVKQLSFGTIENLFYIDYVIRSFSKIRLKKMDVGVRNILRLGVYQIIFLDKVPDSAACNECVELAKKTKNISGAGFINGILRNVVRNKDNIKLPDEKNDRNAYLSIKYSFPIWMIEHFDKAYGKENTEKLLESLNRVQNGICIRVNTLKTTTKELIEKLADENISAKEVSLVRDALTIDIDSSLEEIKAYKDGLFHIQDIASQLCCKALDAHSQSFVLDVCAAPGGKSFTISQMMDNTGLVCAFDVHNKKVNQMKKNAQRLAIKNIRCLTNDATMDYNDLLVKQVFNTGKPEFDYILCDVPCSGLGIINKRAEIKYKAKNEIENLYETQKKILANAAKYLKKGGRLVYSTCTLNPLENEDVICGFVKANPDFEFVDLTKVSDSAFTDNTTAKKGYMTIMPYVNNTDGFFISCIFRK